MRRNNKDNNNSSENIISFLPACCKNKHKTKGVLQDKLYRKYIKHIAILAIISIIITIIISQCKLLEITSESVPYKWCLLFKNIPPKRGDMCVFEHKGRILVKYLVGLPGDKVRIVDKVIYVNNNNVGRIRDNKRLNAIDIETIPEDKAFVIGTHPESFDSRYKKFGFVEESAIKGMAIGLKKR